jgi:RNA polymerase sigma-70 factor (ECF subfamily)
VTSTAQPRARPDEDFVHATDRYRRELLAHCYRMVGSYAEAEDLVQETYLNAWRGYARFEGRSSLRTWLYRIATRTCLKALDRRKRRFLPSDLAAASQDPGVAVGTATTEVGWLQPFPGADPAATVEGRHSLRLALVAALQHLPPRQRAVLILRDVLDLPAAEVAAALDTSTAAVNSALQRARAQLAVLAPEEDELTEPATAHDRAVLDAYAAAFEAADVAALTRLLTAGVSLEMPPIPTWFTGRETVVAFLAGRLGAPGRHRMVPLVANGRPGFGLYRGQGDGGYHAHAIHVPTVGAEGIGRIIAFHEPGLFPAFGLSPVTR